MSNFNVKTAVRQAIMARIPRSELLGKDMDLDAHIGMLMHDDLELYQFGARTSSLGLKALHQLEWVLRDVIQQAATDVMYNANTGGKQRLDSKLDAIESTKKYFETLRAKYRTQVKNVEMSIELPWFSDFSKIGENDDGDPLFQKIELMTKEEFIRYTKTKKFAVGALRKNFDAKFALLKLPALGELDDGLVGESTRRIFRSTLERKAERWEAEGKQLDVKEAMSWIYEGTNPGELGLYIHTVGAFIKAYNRAVSSVIGQLAGYSYNLVNPRLVTGPAGSSPKFFIANEVYEAPNVSELVTMLGRAVGWHTEARIQDWMDAIKSVTPPVILNAIDQPLHGGFEPVDPDNGIFRKLPFEYAMFPRDEADVTDAYDYKAALEYQRQRQESYIRSKQQGLKEAIESFGKIQAPWM